MMKTTKISSITYKYIMIFIVLVFVLINSLLIYSLHLIILQQ